MAKIIVALALLLSATTAGLAQSQSGGSFGTPYSGTAGARNGGHYYSHARSHDSGSESARGSGGGGGGGGGVPAKRKSMCALLRKSPGREMESLAAPAR